MKTPNSKKNNEAPILLGIESSGITCATGISKNSQMLAEISANIRNIHSQKLAPFVNQVLEIANLTAPQIDAIVLSAGPGSFTGLRIGYSTAKGLAHALGVPIIEVSTLDVWAFRAGPQSSPVMPVIDAHRGEIFRAVFHWKNNVLEKKMEDALVTPEVLLGKFKDNILLTGTNAEKLLPQMLEFLPPGSALIQPSPNSPQIWSLLHLGLEKFHRGQFSDVNSCEPQYLRKFKGVS